MKSSFLTLTAMLCFLVPPGVKAQNAQQETHLFNLQECLDYANEHQQDQKNAKLDIQNAEYVIKEQNALGFPQISGTASLQDYLKIPSVSINGQTIQFGTKYQSSAGISVSQLLFDGGYITGLKGSKAYRELYQRSYTRTRIATNVAVTKAYYQLLTNEERFRLLDANIAQLKQQLDETIQLNKQGFVEKIDVDRLSVLYNNLITEHDNTAELLKLGIQVLKFQMGMPVTDDLRIKERIQDIKFAEVPAAALDTTAYRNRVEYGILQSNQRLNELDVTLAKSEYLPKLSAVGSSAVQFMNTSFGNLYGNSLPSTYVGLQLSVPIFSGFMKASRIKQKEVIVLKTRNTMDMLKNSINLEIDNARTMYATNLKSLDNQRKNMELAREVLRVSKIKYEQGVGSSIEVTQAQTAIQEAEGNYVSALYNALASKVDMDAAYGNIK
ncbi:TolC family protein [Hufsiella ginkgonis]|uniref:TolC family protein n=1 Tax=Hufsiella ginkgonis TaxID=2695274 RepID=A0A7K1XWT9_9SPHI|nr:TolC family protein [Hufsiella ginkgonis]MXV15463.1 TolC family protein [Hufsiella ginkgonis]